MTCRTRGAKVPADAEPVSPGGRLVLPVVVDVVAGGAAARYFAGGCVAPSGPHAASSRPAITTKPTVRPAVLRRRARLADWPPSCAAPRLTAVRRPDRDASPLSMPFRFVTVRHLLVDESVPTAGNPDPFWGRTTARSAEHRGRRPSAFGVLPPARGPHPRAGSGRSEAPRWAGDRRSRAALTGPETATRTLPGTHLGGPSCRRLTCT